MTTTTVWCRAHDAGMIDSACISRIRPNIESAPLCTVHWQRLLESPNRETYWRALLTPTRPLSAPQEAEPPLVNPGAPERDLENNRTRDAEANEAWNAWLENFQRTESSWDTVTREELFFDGFLMGWEALRHKEARWPSR